MIYTAALFPHGDLPALPYQYSTRPKEWTGRISTVAPSPFNLNLLAMGGRVGRRNRGRFGGSERGTNTSTKGTGGSLQLFTEVCNILYSTARFEFRSRK